MKNSFLLILAVFVFTLGCSGEKGASKISPSEKDSKGRMATLPEGPLALPNSSDPGVDAHNTEGIAHFKEGHYDVALKHFQEAEKVKPESGEIHFNVALTLDKLGDHGGATDHFKIAQKNANENALILESKVLLAHIK